MISERFFSIFRFLNVGLLSFVFWGTIPVQPVQAYSKNYLLPCSQDPYTEEFVKDSLTEMLEPVEQDPESYPNHVEIWPIYKFFAGEQLVAGYFLAVQDTADVWSLTDLYLCSAGDYGHFYVENEAQSPGFWFQKGSGPVFSKNTVFQDEAGMSLKIHPVDAKGFAMIEFSLKKFGVADIIAADSFLFLLP